MWWLGFLSWHCTFSWLRSRSVCKFGWLALGILAWSLQTWCVFVSYNEDMEVDRFVRALMKLPAGKEWVVRSFSSLKLAAGSTRWPARTPLRKERHRALLHFTFGISRKGLGSWSCPFRWTLSVLKWVFRVLRNRINYRNICSRFWGYCSLLLLSWFRFRFWLLQKSDASKGSLC